MTLRNMQYETKSKSLFEHLLAIFVSRKMELPFKSAFNEEASGCPEAITKVNGRRKNPSRVVSAGSTRKSWAAFF